MGANHVREAKQGCPKKKGGQPNLTGKRNLSWDKRDGCEPCEKGKVGMSEEERWAAKPDRKAQSEQG